MPHATTRATCAIAATALWAALSLGACASAADPAAPGDEPAAQDAAAVLDEAGQDGGAEGGSPAAGAEDGSAADAAESVVAAAESESTREGALRATTLAEGEAYSYDDLQADVDALAQAYPEWVQADALAVTFDERQVRHLVIGNPNADVEVLVVAGVGGSEGATTQLAMRQAATFLQHADAGDALASRTYADTLGDVAIHVIPCLNPDGVAICQNGMAGAQTTLAGERLLEISVLDGNATTDAYYRTWDANASGVDLNRQFDVLWDDYRGASHPSSERYKGAAPDTEPETRALMDLSGQREFDLALVYHEGRSTVRWYYGQEGALAQRARAVAEALAAQTGYEVDADMETVDPATYAAWATQRLSIPCVSVDVDAADASALWETNGSAWETVVQQAMELEQGK